MEDPDDVGPSLILLLLLLLPPPNVKVRFCAALDAGDIEDVNGEADMDDMLAECALNRLMG